MNPLHRPIRLPALLLGLSLLLTACPDQTSLAPEMSITAIEASATPTTLNSAATANLTATVSGKGAFSPAVNWSILSGGGNLSASTGSSVTYTAPSVTSDTSVQIRAAASGDPNVSKTITITVQPVSATPKPIINAFSATPATLTAAGPVTLNWDVSGATSLSIDSGVGAVTGTSKAVNVTSTTAFTLTATNANGSSTKTVTVAVASQSAPPTVVSVSPDNGAKGVRADAKIVVTFSQAMDQAATQAAYQSADLPTVGVTFDWNAAGTEMTIKPNAPLDYAKSTDISAMAKNYEFKLTSTAKDKGGLALTPLTSSFKTLRQVTTTLLGEALRSGYVQSDGYVSKSGELMYVGDNERNLGIRGFISFDLSELSAGISSGLLSATLKLQKYSDNTVQFRVGSPYSLAINPTRLNQVDLDHVAYGSSLDSSDYDTNSIALLGSIDSFAQRSTARTQADVLSAVLDDLTNSAARENRSQYRMSLFQRTNNDSAYDYIVYGSASAEPKPSLVLEYLTP